MDRTRSPLRAVFDYVGFMVYATIVGWGLPERDVAEAAHPRHLFGFAEADRPRLAIVPVSVPEALPEVSPATLASDDTYMNAA